MDYKDHLDALFQKANVLAIVPQVIRRKKKPKEQYSPRSRVVYDRSWHGIFNEAGAAYVGGCIAEWLLFLHERYEDDGSLKVKKQ